MSTQTPTAVALCGKAPSHIVPLIDSLLPKGYDIIHVCRSTESATTELPALLRNEQQPPPAPSSGYGSNATTNASNPTPGSAIKAIIIGGGFAPNDFEEIKKACDAVRQLPFFRADINKKRTDGKAGAGVGPPPVEELVERVLGAMEEARKSGNGGGEWEKGVYLF